MSTCVTVISTVLKTVISTIVGQAAPAPEGNIVDESGLNQLVTETTVEPLITEGA